jgi:hypothetical protein
MTTQGASRPTLLPRIRHAAPPCPAALQPPPRPPPQVLVLVLSSGHTHSYAALLVELTPLRVIAGLQLGVYDQVY